ncbi:MAG: HDIG domain-containing protein [Proteobacteria bacterium]|nr:HDIG domain-containing protein [Pseudomonadota bacterium]MBU1585882.1 HDIG domain-containing protein [Pseudomonadota bacterium]MBU2454670.1 HDIG domain-containing protein [Pseudomonadota bacterium]MBU2627961.1 HDIG domain-containing protein [Pseudomonadota bacterium]
MKIPSRKECFGLIKKMDMMDHIINHSIMVSNVALFLSIKLKKHSPNLNSRLATSAALLHDITKTRSFNTKESHSETGGLMLTELGYPEVGDIIRQHVILDSYEIHSPISEQEIVNYSDKRILHDKVVSLDKRLEYIQLRYGSKKEFKDHIHRMWSNTVNLENKIFCHLDITPDQLSQCITSRIKKQDWA